MDLSFQSERASSGLQGIRIEAADGIAPVEGLRFGFGLPSITSDPDVSVHIVGFCAQTGSCDHTSGPRALFWRAHFNQRSELSRTSLTGAGEEEGNRL
jgi:hypothetical protein